MTVLFSPNSPFESAPVPTSGSQFALILQDARFIQYVILATFVLTVFDYIITLDEEIRLVWCRPTPLCRQIIFLVNRYLPFCTASLAAYFGLVNTSQDPCHIAHYVMALIAWAGAVFAEWTMLLRTSAICGSKTVSAILMFLAVATPIGTGVNTFFYIHGSSPLDINMPHRGCIFWYRLKIEWISVVALIFCESVAFCLLFARTIKLSRQPKSNIMMEICKDSIFYFIFIIASSLVNLFIQLFASNLLCDAFLIPQSVLHQILCTHFILSLRRLSEQASSSQFVPRPHIPLEPLTGTWCESRCDSNIAV